MLVKEDTPSDKQFNRFSMAEPYMPMKKRGIAGVLIWHIYNV